MNRPTEKTGSYSDEVLYYTGARKLWGGRYVEVSPNHPYRIGHTKYVMEHRRIVERYLGRFLFPDELVHHCDHDGTNNDLSNLELVNQHSHNCIHNKKNAKKFSDAEVLAALEKNDYKLMKTAAHLNIYFQYLYDNYAHLLHCRSSPGFLDSKIIEVCNSCKEVGMPLTAKIFCTNKTTLLNYINKWTADKKIPDNFLFSVRKKAKSGYIDEHIQEICKQTMDLGLGAAANLHGLNPESIRQAFHRLSKSGVLTPELVYQLTHLPRKKKV